MSSLGKIGLTWLQCEEAATLLSKDTGTTWHVKWNIDSGCMEIFVKTDQSQLSELDNKIKKFFSEQKLGVESVIHVDPMNQDRRLAFSRKINDSELIATLVRISRERISLACRYLAGHTGCSWKQEGDGVSMVVDADKVLEAMGRLMTSARVPYDALSVKGDGFMTWKISITDADLIRGYSRAFSVCK